MNMATSVCNALGTDQENLVGKLIAVEEHHGSNGNFVLNCLIGEQVHKEGSVCLVAYITLLDIITMWVQS